MATFKINAKPVEGTSPSGWIDLRENQTSAVALGTSGWTIAYDASALPAGALASGLDITPTGDALWIGASGDTAVYRTSHQAESTTNWRRILLSGPPSTGFTLQVFSTWTSARNLEFRVNAGTIQTLVEHDGTSPNDSETLTFNGTTDGSGQATLEYKQDGGGFAHLTAMQIEVPEAASTTLDQTTLTPGGTISGTCSNYNAAPTSPISVSDGTNTDSVTVTISGTGPYTFTGTMPATPTVADGSVTVTVGEASTTATYSDGVTAGLPAFTLQKDGTTKGDLTGIKCTVVAGTDMSGAELFFASNLTATAGVMGSIDLSATDASVGDTVTVSLLTTDNEGITFTTTVGNLEA